MDEKSTESQLWIMIADAFDSAYKSGRSYPIIFDRKCFGICIAIDVIHHELPVLERDATCSMRKRIRLWLVKSAGSTVGYAFPLTLEGAKQRADLCRKFAEESSP